MEYPRANRTGSSFNTRSDGGGTGGTTRLLGLNRNRGQVIELRLRTDAYDGWLKYKDVRKVLCHELAHNIHDEHDEKFWALFHKLEREVVDLDPFGKRGRTIFAGERYDGPMLKVAGDDSEGDNVDERDFSGLAWRRFMIAADGLAGLMFWAQVMMATVVAAGDPVVQQMI